MLKNMLKDLVNNGALVALCNRNGECPLDRANQQLAHILEGNVTVPLIMEIRFLFI